jgi:lysine decarboxylase
MREFHLKTILALIPANDEVKAHIFNETLEAFSSQTDFNITRSAQRNKILKHLEANPRICCVLYDFALEGLEFCDEVQLYNPDLPIFAFTDNETYIEADLKTLKFNLHFLNYRTDQGDITRSRILSTIDEYVEELVPPFTKALIDYAGKNKYSYCTPGHAGGSAFLNSPLGTIFYDFYGPNIFKSDLSVSMTELGSLLDHSGTHKQAEEFMAKQYGSDYCYIVTGGGSTSNKMIAMHVASDGQTVLIDRNCHKSVTHFLMMSNVYPLYLVPSRNWYGIIGGIDKQQFTQESIQAKRRQLSSQLSCEIPAPTYAVITNSTYDGILYQVDYIKEKLDVPNLHFDAAWIPYAPFSPIYKSYYGMSGGTKKNQTVYESYSAHKLLAAFSQAAMIHVRGNLFDPSTFSDSYMMHASTSPFYPIVASTETAVAMMRGQHGVRLMDAALQESFTFRKEIERLREENDSEHAGWFYDILQPTVIGKEMRCFSLSEKEKWHGYSGDVSHLSLDPIKITLLSPGLLNNQYDELGIPACLIAKYLGYQGIEVEKSGPYSLLFLFGIGSDRSKSLKLLNELTSFKRAFDDNQKIEKILPNLYQEAPRFYRKYTIQQLAAEIHQLYIKKDLCGLMYKAYEALPTMIFTPYQARQFIIKQKVKRVPLTDLLGHVCSEMILPYPPGIPLVLPGERLDEKSKVTLDFLQTLCQIGDEYPGIETNIHGVNFDQKGQAYTHVIDREMP